MERRNRYTTRIGRLMMVRIVLGAALLLGAGVGYVLVRNDQVLIGNQIRTIEDDIVKMDRQIELWELRIAGVRDRQEMSRRLRWAQSDLQSLDQRRILNISPALPGSVPVASAY